MKIVKESGTDRAKEALSKYIDDIDYLNDGIELIVRNTQSLYNQYRNKRVKSHSVVWSGLLELIKSDLHEELTSAQLQAGFKALGLDYKEFLEPIVKNMEERRNEELNESVLIEVPESEVIEENLNESKAEEEGLEEIINKLDKIGATPDNILDNEIKSKYDSVLSKLGVELKKGEVPFIYKVSKNGKQIGRINFNKVAKKWEFSISTFELEGKDTTVTDYLNLLSDVSDFEITQALKKSLKYGLITNKAMDFIVKDIKKDTKTESKTNTIDVATVVDKINELESELEMFSNDPEVDQKDIKSVKDKIYRLTKKLIECLHNLPTEIEEGLELREDKDTNIENIKKALKVSGISNERTLDLMSKDVLKTLEANYDKDCKDSAGNYYNPAITSAIQDVIQRITGGRPKASIGEEKVDKLLFADKELNESIESSNIIDMLEKRDTPYIKSKDGERIEIRVNDSEGSFEFRTLDDTIIYTAKDENELNSILKELNAELIDTNKLMR